MRSSYLNLVSPRGADEFMCNKLVVAAPPRWSGNFRNRPAANFLKSLGVSQLPRVFHPTCEYGTRLKTYLFVYFRVHFIT